MPGVPEQPKPREEHSAKKEEKEVDSATQTDDNDNQNSNQKSSKGNSDELSDARVAELKKDPKVVVHCELQEELDKEFEERGLHFDSPSKPGEEGNKDSNESNDKQKGGDDTSEQKA